MNTIRVNRKANKTTEISNAFIDRYMVTAGSSHLKTYLLFMRLYSDPLKEISICKMADFLDCSESDILRSLRYWEKCGLFRLSYADADHKVVDGIEVLEITDGEKTQEGASGAQESGIREGESRNTNSHDTNRHDTNSHDGNCYGTDSHDTNGHDTNSHDGNSYGTNSREAGTREANIRETGSPENADFRTEPSKDASALNNSLYQDHSVDFNRVSTEEQFGRLTFIAEQYIGKPLSRNDCEILAWIYDRLSLDVDLIIYLVEYCVSNDHRSLRYMEKVAIDWHSKQITTVEQAKIYTPLYNRNLYSVMNALGMGDRQPGLAERRIIDSWFQEMGFSLELVVEACNRTMISIHEPNLKYVESILTRWKNAGISGIEQVKALDEEHSKKNAAASSQKPENGQKRSNGQAAGNNNQKKPGGRFHGFDQRSTDYDALLKGMNNRKTDQGQ